MTDNAAIYNEGLWLPNDIWATIASFLDNKDLNQFRQLCSATQFVGSNVIILQPLYNRLYAMDDTLPPLLPQEGTLTAFKQACEKIQAKQQSEITYLTKCHPTIMAKTKYKEIFKKSVTMLLQSLEAKNASLNKINRKIIKTKINLNRTGLDLDGIGITRLSAALFQEPAEIHFWRNLTYLSCNQNKLDILNVQELAKLQWLSCNENQLTTLNVKGLAVLKGLECNNNQLTTLNVQGLTALKELLCNMNKLLTLNLQGLATLKKLNCHNNPLKTLILTGVHASTKDKYAELERILLFNKLSQTNSPQARRAIIRRLGADYTPENCRKYCPIYATKLFASDSANSVYHCASNALSQTSVFLPSFTFGVVNIGLKRKRDEDEIDIEKPSEESDYQPDLKKRKKIT